MEKNEPQTGDSNHPKMWSSRHGQSTDVDLDTASEYESFMSASQFDDEHHPTEVESDTDDDNISSADVSIVEDNESVASEGSFNDRFDAVINRDRRILEEQNVQMKDIIDGLNESDSDNLLASFKREEPSPPHLSRPLSAEAQRIRFTPIRQHSPVSSPPRDVQTNFATVRPRSGITRTQSTQQNYQNRRSNLSKQQIAIRQSLNRPQTALRSKRRNPSSHSRHPSSTAHRSPYDSVPQSSKRPRSGKAYNSSAKTPSTPRDRSFQPKNTATTNPQQKRPVSSSAYQHQTMRARPSSRMERDTPRDHSSGIQRKKMRPSTAQTQRAKTSHNASATTTGAKRPMVRLKSGRLVPSEGTLNQNTSPYIQLLTIRGNPLAHTSSFTTAGDFVEKDEWESSRRRQSHQKRKAPARRDSPDDRDSYEWDEDRDRGFSRHPHDGDRYDGYPLYSGPENPDSEKRPSFTTTQIKRMFNSNIHMYSRGDFYSDGQHQSSLHPRSRH
ncbi:hypothetical protein BLNAU_15545 [Blattamonas nauphoetae]|uniref:Uncharacterized protein n=1 Tax=Blattamonas nauphoetae TaxID=2049346 RepID=A0ABQ9XE46_9EUKA|nr:hypothetical protein BLNAU_15545 [Blattamonas nauphoetae]